MKMKMRKRNRGTVYNASISSTCLIREKELEKLNNIKAVSGIIIFRDKEGNSAEIDIDEFTMHRISGLAIGHLTEIHEGEGNMINVIG